MTTSDPNFFHLDYSRLIEVLTTLIIFSAFIERALSVIFESKFYIRWFTVTDMEATSKVITKLITRKFKQRYNQKNIKERQRWERRSLDSGVQPLPPPTDNAKKFDPNIRYPRKTQLFVIIIRNLLLSILASSKEIIGLLVSICACFYWKFDAITIILMSSDHVRMLGMLATGIIVAGGTKASVGFFRDVCGIMSTAEKERLLRIISKR